MDRDASMERWMYGFVSHDCAPLSRSILIPIGLEKYSSKVIATAQCQICGQKALESTVDRTFQPSKGTIMAV